MRALRRRAAGVFAGLAALSTIAVAQQNGAGGASGTAKPTTVGKSATDPINAEGYISPPDAIAKLIAAPRSSNWTWGAPSPTRKWLLHPLTEEPTLEYLGKKHYNLGGWQVDPVSNRSRAMTYRNTSGYEFFDWAANKTIKVQLPPNARGSTFTSWSPDGMTFAYFAQLPDATHIYLADPNTGISRPLTKTTVNATNVSNFEWTADGKSIVTVLVPDTRGPEPKDPEIATGIRVRVNENNQLKTRNFADLLESPYDKALFEYFNLGQLAIIDVKTRVVTKVGAPGMIRSIDPSPDGKYFRVTYLDQPFSYILQTTSFGTHDVIIDASGKELKQLARRELSEGVATDIDPADQPRPPAGGGGRGGNNPNADSTKRNLAWHPFDAGLTFFRSGRIDSVTRFRADSTAKAAAARGARGGNGGGNGGGNAGGRGGRGGNGGADSAATRPDTMFLWSPPFNSSASPEFKPLYVTEAAGTINSVEYSDNGRIMFVNETVGGQTKTDAIYLDENNARFTVIRGGAGGGGGGRGRGGAGGGGGRGGAGGGAGAGLLMKSGTRGQPVVMMSADSKYVYTNQAAAGAGRGGRGGRGAAPAPAADADADSTSNAQHPFVDRIEIKTGTRSRVYEASVTDKTEAALTPLNDEITKGITTRQSRSQPAESFLVDVATKNATQLTHAKDYWPEITNAVHKTVMARRPDGVAIRIRVTLPPDYKEGTKLPALFWFYPAEFDSAGLYTASLAGGGGGRGGAGGTGPGTFSAPGQRTMSFVTAAGYALIENDAPIIGTPGKLPNDNYTTDLVWDLEAAVNALDTLKIVDRNRLALGGHSYGAFSTMNAMTLTSLFKAGIAGDGMYNRTLTPNGFQNERRDLWTGQATYLAMSPMLRADKLQGAILMYHSEEDQNVGTDPISSIRMYQALMANGKNAALYMYPYEDHGPVARESNLDQWARWVAWLDKYVKNPAAPPKAQ